MQNPSLTALIKEYVGSDRAAAREFKRILKEVHAERRSAAEENNTAMSDVFQNFGYGGGKFATIVRLIRDGNDLSSRFKLDQLVEYAARNYRYLMPSCHGESDSGSDEEAFCTWVSRGFLEWPAIDSAELLEETAGRMGLLQTSYQWKRSAG